MTIKSAPMGDYQTNCYIVTINGFDLIIDPGMYATNWVLENTTNPVAILNTHGHFDHVWSNQELKDKLNLPIYCPKDDAFMLEHDPLRQGTPPSSADILVEHNEIIEISGIKAQFFHFPGHTPGCSAILIENCLFSGDFIFKGSIGRSDFPYSDSQLMKESINKILTWDKDYEVYPGHGAKTTLSKEKYSLTQWLKYI